MRGPPWSGVRPAAARATPQPPATFRSPAPIASIRSGEQGRPQNGTRTMVEACIAPLVPSRARAGQRRGARRVPDARHRSAPPALDKAAAGAVR
jgi:hypothetical protein